jgi:hypothetical protein
VKAAGQKPGRFFISMAVPIWKWYVTAMKGLLLLIIGAALGGVCRAGELEKAVATAPEEQKAAMKFLVDNLPAKDAETITADYLLENVRLAFEARNATTWARAVPEEVFFNDVLPYSSVHEDVDRWRPGFFAKFMPLVKSCTSTTEAAQALNAKIWDILDVHYNVKRDKPDQSPSHSMRIHMASCTGLSILLVDACRSVGVPARFVGCKWRKIDGNHSWVEIYDGGKWSHIGAEDFSEPNHTWFEIHAKDAIPRDARYAIQAASWKKTDEPFRLAFREDSLRNPVPGIDVTEAYLDKGGVKPPSLFIDVLDAAGKRIAKPIKVVEIHSGVTLAEGEALDDRHDLNEHFAVSAPFGSQLRIDIDGQKPGTFYTMPATNSFLRVPLTGKNGHAFFSAPEDGKSVRTRETLIAKDGDSLAFFFEKFGASHSSFAVTGECRLAHNAVSLKRAGYGDAFGDNGIYTLITYAGNVATPDISGLTVAEPLFGKDYVFSASDGAIRVAISTHY